MAAGRVSCQSDVQGWEPLQLDMQRLAVEGRAEARRRAAAREIDPRDLPAIAVRAGDFRLARPAVRPNVQADVRRDPGSQLTSLSAQSAAFGLTGTGTWLAEDSARGRGWRSSFSSTDLAAASRALGYRGSVDAAQARVRSEST